MRFCIYWTLLAGLLGCTNSDKSGTDSGTDTAAQQNGGGGGGGGGNGDGTVQGTLVVLDPLDSSGVEGVPVESDNGISETTNTDGMARISLEPGGTFQFSVSHGVADTVDHQIFGPTGTENFIYPVHLATEAMLETVNAVLGTTTALETGMVAVYIHDDDGQPVMGVSASIGTAHDDSWAWMTDGAPSTFGDPVFGDAVPEGGNGIVVFPNTFPGPTTVTVSPPDGVTCAAFPGGGQMPTTPVLMNNVTIVAFRCQN